MPFTTKVTFDQCGMKNLDGTPAQDTAHVEATLKNDTKTTYTYVVEFRLVNTVDNKPETLGKLRFDDVAPGTSGNENTDIIVSGPGVFKCELTLIEKR